MKIDDLSLENLRSLKGSKVHPGVKGFLMGKEDRKRQLRNTSN